MKQASLLCAASVAAVALLVPSAHASKFTISFDGGPVGFSGSGVFDVTRAGDVYTVTGVESGSVTDPFLGTLAITSLNGTFGGPDQEFTLPSTTYFDESGFSFNLSDGLAVNLYTDSGLSSEVRSDGQAELVTDSITRYVPAAATPEPSSFALLGTGLLGVAGAMRNRFA